MNLEPFTGPGSTTTRRAFWDKVFASVISARKTEGKNISVTEYEGQGTLVNFKRDRVSAAVCPPPNPCTLDFSVTVPAPNGWSTTQTGLDMYVGDCQYTTGDGWHANHWASEGCADPDCSNNSNSVCNNLPEACKCAWYGRWRDPSGGLVQIKLALVQGDDVVTPDGWWLLIGVSNAAQACFWGDCQSGIGYYGAWLASDASIFSTQLDLSLSLPFDTGGGCGPDPITFDITFHPC